MNQISFRVVMVILTCGFMLSGCAKPMTEFKPKNQDESAMIKTILEYQKLVNAYKFNEFHQLFTPNGQIAGLPVKEYVATNKDNLDRFKESKCSIKYNAPDSLKMDGINALVIISRFMDCRNQTATNIYDMKKSDGSWLIDKVSRE